MGEVYRARDTKLGREVAIKILPEEFSRDKERVARFEREAKVLASLNHTNIATLYGLEEWDGRQILVMELIEGETLAERIAVGPIPVDEAVALYIQIAEGLEAAHRGSSMRSKPVGLLLADLGGPTPGLTSRTTIPTPVSVQDGFRRRRPAKGVTTIGTRV